MGDKSVTVQTVPCTSLHGIRGDEVMVSGYLLLDANTPRRTRIVKYRQKMACIFVLSTYLQIVKR